jgi:hypothetical protein
MKPETSRRDFIRAGSVTAAGIVAAATARLAAGQDEPQTDHSAHQHDKHQEGHDDKGQRVEGEHQEGDFPRMHAGRGGPIGSTTDRGKLVSGYRSAGDPPIGVIMPDVPILPWEMKDGVKEFHLVAEHVRREVLPDQWFDFWGYNGSMPGPMIEAFAGDRVRIVVHNNLPEATTVHWHGLELPNAMDGVHGITQEAIPSGGEFNYEFDLHQDGTFFYHSHGPMQEIMGMTGLFVIHPRDTYEPVVDHDFGLIMQEFAVLPQSTVPNSVSEDFNFFTINGRSGPFTTPLVVRLGSRVRIRFMNLSAMDNHPMHLHGHTFWVTGTEGGRIPESAWIPTNNVLVAVGQSRDVEFIANNPGDWMIHCHILHHMMNHMVSMVGPMPMSSGTDGKHHSGHGASAMSEMRGDEFASGALGAGLEPSLGPAVSPDRAVMTGMRPSDMQAKFKVPGYPQDMMEMHGILTPTQMRKVSTPLTRGMRRNWPMGTQAMMTILRVLPDDLYEKVISGEGHIEPGASVPGAGPGQEMGGHGGHQMQNMQQDGSTEHAGHNAHGTQPAMTPPRQDSSHENH